MRFLITLLGAGAGAALGALLVPALMRLYPALPNYTPYAAYAALCLLGALIFFALSNAAIERTLKLIAAIERRLEGMTTQQIERALATQSGMLGISGVSGDLREVQAAMDEGNERAKLAVDMYVSQVARYIAGYAVELGGLDAIAFTGGIGENSVRLRRMVLEGMAHLGLKIDVQANEQGSGERRITTEDSAVAAFVIPANEELMVVRETFALCD